MPEEGRFRIGVLQFRPAFGDAPANLERVRVAARGRRWDLLVLPELCTTGYVFRTRAEVESLAEAVPGRATDHLATVAREIGGHVVAGLAERAGGGVYNSAVLVGPDGVVAVYRKAHLFGEEKVFFSRGDVPFRVITLPTGARVGMLVCFDHRFPEAARVLALQGAQVIAHPSNLVLAGQAQLTSRVRALENRVFWVLANRWGIEDRGEGKRLRFTGASQVVGPDGAVLASGPEEGDALVEAAVRLADADDKRITPQNDALADRRPDLYGALVVPPGAPGGSSEAT